MSIKLYCAGDTGPSGFGVATRGFIKRLVDVEDINVNFRTHQWGWNEDGWNLKMGEMAFPDTRFREKMIREGHVNDEYLLADVREIGDRNDDLMQNLNSDGENLMIKQHDVPYDEVDIWYTAGGVGFAEQAPDEPYSILHCDYNLDIVPDMNVKFPIKQQFYNLLDSPYTPLHRQESLEELELKNEKDLEEYIINNSISEICDDFARLLEEAGNFGDDETGPGVDSTKYEQFFEQLKFYADEMVDEDGGWGPKLKNVNEIWVPSEWTKKAIIDRYPELTDRVKAFHYGIEMDYKPGAYDHENCPDAHGRGMQAAIQEECLDDGQFNFLVISRIYHIKGLYRTIKAYVEEFNENDDVRMYVKTTSNQQFDFNAEASVQNIVNELQYPDAPEIGIGIDAMDTQHLYDLMGHCDAFVQASRAECFGIAQLQAAWCKTPVIATNWSSQKEVCGTRDEGFYMLDDFELERPEPEAEGIMFQHSDYYPLDSKWAVPDIDSLGDLMREVYELNEVEREVKGDLASSYVEHNYQWIDKIQPRIERMRNIVEEREQVRI